MHITNFVGAGVTAEQADLYRISVDVSPAFTFKDGSAVNFSYPGTTEILNGTATIPNMETEYAGNPLPWAINVTIEPKAGGQSPTYRHLKTFPEGTVEGAVVEFATMIDTQVVTTPEFGPTWAEQARADAIVATNARAGAEVAQAAAASSAATAGSAAAAAVGSVAADLAALETSIPNTYMKTADDATITGAKTFSSLKGLRSTTWFGLGAGVGSARNPFYMNSIVDAASIPNSLAAGGGDDYVGIQNNVKAVGNFAALKTMLVGSITSGSNVLTLTSGTFTSPIFVGYTVYIPGAGAGGGQPLKTKITSITDNTHAVLGAPASTTIAGATITATLAADHDYFFYANDFFTTGTGATDLQGISNVFGRLIELHLYTPGRAFNTLKAASVELDIEASAVGSSVASAIGLEISAVRNAAAAAVTNAYGLLIHGSPSDVATNVYGLYVDGGGKTVLTGATRISALGSAEVPLIIRTPLGPTAPALEVRDVTGANRVFQIANSGGVGSSQGFTAYEGLGAQTTIGAVAGGFSGIRFGASGVEIRQHTTGAVQVSNAKAFGVPAVTTANRLSATNAGAGGVCLDTTLGKLIFSDGTNWKDSTGATV